MNLMQSKSLVVWLSPGSETGGGTVVDPVQATRPRHFESLVTDSMIIMTVGFWPKEPWLGRRHLNRLVLKGTASIRPVRMVRFNAEVEFKCTLELLHQRGIAEDSRSWALYPGLQVSRLKWPWLLPGYTLPNAQLSVTTARESPWQIPTRDSTTSMSTTASRRWSRWQWRRDSRQ
jgi:hypothetical protein